MIINDLDGYYIVFDTKNWNTELDTLVNNKEYEANFYQKSRIEGDSIKWKEQFKLSYLKEHPNVSLKDIEAGCKVIFELGKLIGKSSKHVWFTIRRNYYDSYNILYFYDNEYNKPNGEDL